MNEAKGRITRRKFLSRVALGGAIGAGILAIIGTLREVIPPLARENKKFKVGRLYDFPLNRFFLVTAHNVFIYRDYDGVRAMSAVCTHLGCVLEATEEGFQCPCHGSRFNDKGRVLSGPAPRALTFFKVEVAPDGQLLVDMSHKVSFEEKLKIS
ncbi:MAG: Rieske 2Fe-2S domain-containing protein [Candidatus Aminicenantes bacterium]|jgi:nitrite reductase/ring-hydroxylating ferredoxin subunit